MDARMQPPPPVCRPSVGRSWCRVFSTRYAARAYEHGWLNPDKYQPSAHGSPAEKGALDRLQDRSE